MSSSENKATCSSAEVAKYRAYIEELERRNESLIQENMYLRELYDRSPLGYQCLDEKGCLVAINKAWLDTLGYEKEEVIGRNFADFLGQEWKEPFQKNFPKLKAVGEILGFEFEMVRKDGSLLLVNLDGRVGTNINGEFQQTYCIIKDITARRKAEETQQKLQNQLVHAQKNKALCRLVRGISHDFSNMLAAILGHVELAKRYCEPDKTLYKRLDGIENTARRSVTLLEQLLAFAGKQIVHPRVININECVISVWDMLLKTIGKDIKLKNSLSENISAVNIDPLQIDQILTALCRNARDAIEETGTVVLSTRDILIEVDNPFGNILITPGTYVQLSVSDTGSGMDPATLDQIFEPFFSTKSKGMGSGLGLSSIDGVAKQNNGFIEVCSTPDIGTSVGVFLPSYSAEDLNHGLEEVNLPRGEGEQVLVVAAAESIRDTFKVMLPRFGYKVVYAESGEKALEMVRHRSEKIDLLITDLFIPGMTGRALHYKLREILPDIACLFTAGYSASILPYYDLQEEAENYLEQPFSYQELAEAVCRRVSRSTCVYEHSHS
ncbi:PAS domain S-box protein [Desulfogranum japonicum]|uniref:PAS domain S-box protein n=1 Tax=Desulfogranum japonicum TaxID=231447 RepID=UPI000401387D|nr:PAS domain S-box protein [Desulfogranum japonicum]